MDEAKRTALATFLINDCSLVVICVDTAEEALAMYAVENETREAHNPSDEAKQALTTIMAASDHDEAQRIWDEWQGRLGAANFMGLLNHIRTLHPATGSRAAEPLPEALIHAFDLDQPGQGAIFMREVAERARHTEMLRAGAAVSAAAGARGGLRNALPATLFWLDHDFYMAPALAWLAAHGDKHPETETFFRRLDADYWVALIAGTPPTKQLKLQKSLLADIGPSGRLVQLTQIVLDPETLAKALARLRSRTFAKKHSFCPLVLRRLDCILGTDFKVLGEEFSGTVEHVLPRRPADGSAFKRAFPAKADVEEWCDRLGNLVLLPSKDNQRNGNSDFDVKRRVLKGSANALARDAGAAGTWNKDTIRERTDRLIGLIAQDLGITGWK